MKTTDAVLLSLILLLMLGAFQHDHLATERRLSRIETRQDAVLQTARGAYLGALRQALSALPAGDTIKLG